MPPTAAQVRRILGRLRSARRTEQGSLLHVLRGLAETGGGSKALLEAGAVPALLELVRSSNGRERKAAAEVALAVLMQLGKSDQNTLCGPNWKAAMLAANALLVVVRQLGSSSADSQLFAAVILGDLCLGDNEAAVAAVQHGAAGYVIEALQRPADPDTQQALLYALWVLAMAPQAAAGLLQNGAAEAIASLVLSGRVAEQAQPQTAWLLRDLTRGSEVRTRALARTGGIRALLRLMQHGSLEAAAAAAQALDSMLGDAPAVQAVAIAEGAIPALEAYLQAHPDSPEAELSERLLNLLRTAQHPKQAQQ
ncbi:hypothetical protein COHA_003891 [Chlorella ohadii]|uniref:Uncharacterized protein n=1 Tax=Chlorella ohadii TaxID=2649997 RepID=A0AAD5DUC4_9CHLO|nr:hypothetical protein COHA_003891 [Chlorella ohadii]